MKISAKERMQIAIKAAAERLAQWRKSIPEINVPLSPGHVYVFDVGDIDIAIEWLVVRDHPEDPNWVLAVPIDNFPLVGTPDLSLPGFEPDVARCGQSDWFPKSMFDPTLRVDVLSDDVFDLVKQRLADLARGRAITPTDPPVDYDPEYEDHIEEIERARLTLLSRAE